jgi:hypothetical protein
MCTTLRSVSTPQKGDCESKDSMLKTKNKSRLAAAHRLMCSIRRTQQRRVIHVLGAVFLGNFHWERMSLIWSITYEQWMIVLEILPRSMWQICLDPIERRVTKWKDTDPRKFRALLFLARIEESSRRKYELRREMSRLETGSGSLLYLARR